MGITAVKLFNHNNIKVILDAKGRCEDIIQAYMNGQLNSTKSECEIFNYEELNVE